MNMVEKVAMVLYEYHSVKSMDIARDMARNAIKAMRDISDDIIEMKVKLPTGDDCREDTRFEWEMMIDAALKE